MKLAKHPLHLPVQRRQFRGVSKLIKQNGVAFNFRYLEAHLVGVDQGLEHFLDDEPAVLNFRFADEPRKAADVGNKDQPFGFHFSFKVTFNGSFLEMSGCKSLQDSVDQLLNWASTQR